MNTLRWLLGIVTTLLLAGYILLVIAGGNFRRSFGASPLSPLLAVLPCVVLGRILASLLWPGLALIAAAFILRESITTGILAIGYLASWLAFYWIVKRTPLANG